MTHTITLEINCSGEYTERELHEYLLYSLGVGSCSCDNPFINEYKNAELDFAEIQ